MQVQVQVQAQSAAGWSGRRLEELNLFYWAAALSPDRSWPATADHED